MTAYPFPPRYFIGYIVFDDGRKMVGHDLQFFPASKYQAIIVPYNANSPLAGFLEIPIAKAYISEIQYSIACLDQNGYLVETLNHKFNPGTTQLFKSGGLPHIYAINTPLFTTVRSVDIFEDISRDLYPVTQFVS